MNLWECTDWYFPAYQKIFGKRVVIYGAGNYGRALCKEFIRAGCYDNIAAWVDKNYKVAVQWGDEHPDEFVGMLMRNVEQVDSIRDMEFDYIAIAIADENTACEVSKELQEVYDVPADKIIWSKAFRKDLSSILSVAYL